VLTAGELVFRRNTAVDGGALYVGNGVTATVRRSEFSENEAMYGGAVEVSGRLLMTNTTLSRNSATQDGGGIWFVNAQEISILDNSTLFGNVAANGANLNVNGGQVRVRNSAIGRTPGFTVTNCALSLGAVFEPSNIADDASCAGATTQADLKLGPLTGNGGPTRSHLPLSGSPLIDVVLAGCPSRDQRDVERPQGPRCDVGAVEAFVGRMYLPAALNNAAGSLVEIEPNNTALQATGPLALGAPYTGAPNDANDYYVFALPSAASVTVELTGHPGESLNQVQLQLRDAGDVQIDFAFAPPFRLTRSLPAGTYYVRVFHAPPGAFPNTPAYTVKVSSP
jgi:predicted outer membrane repeat protein